MKISFELSDKDLRYFRQVLQKVRKGRNAENENVVLGEAAALLEEVKNTDAPQFVRSRIAQLSKLIDMVEDKDWRLEGADRKRVLNALAYFADPDDLIPDRVPGLGYLGINAILSSDIDVVRALVLIGALLFVVSNLLTDLCYAAVDPRVKLK